MSFFLQVFEFKMLYQTIKCVYLKYGIEYYQTCLNNEIFRNSAEYEIILLSL